MIPWIFHGFSMDSLSTGNFRHVHGYEVSGSLSDWGIHCGIWAVNRTGLLSFSERWTGQTGGSKIAWWPEATVIIYYVYIYIYYILISMHIYIYIWCTYQNCTLHEWCGIMMNYLLTLLLYAYVIIDRPWISKLSLTFDTIVINWQTVSQ